ncbi:unnamed protein product [Prorocentrum cordatum]|uniref:Uncharacterized protein n=1 Tax=Prorocentrum cordatum TaxID=2364126 RepID=A0ABN9TA55_9DINO|nr:unnamed protein product [Polarella glacialis]
MVSLHVVSAFTPLAWSWEDFAVGSAEAVRALHALLGERDHDALRGLLAEPLRRSLLEAGDHSQEGWARPPSVKSVRPLGVHTATAHEVPAEEGGGAVVRVVPLMRVVEEYAYLG